MGGLICIYEHTKFIRPKESRTCIDQFMVLRHICAESSRTWYIYARAESIEYISTRLSKWVQGHILYGFEWWNHAGRGQTAHGGLGYFFWRWTVVYKGSTARRNMYIYIYSYIGIKWEHSSSIYIYIYILKLHSEAYMQFEGEENMPKADQILSRHASAFSKFRF